MFGSLGRRSAANSLDTAPEPSDASGLLREWHRRIREAQWAHYQSQRRLQRLHYFIGIPLVVLAAVSSTALLTNTSDGGQFTATATSLIAAVLAALQTFLGLGDRAAAHRVAGGEYSDLRRRVEELLAFGGNEDEMRREVAVVREAMSGLAGRSPVISRAAWRNVERKLRSHAK